MTSEQAALASIATHLSELTQRVTEVADDLSRGDEDDVSTALYEVERSLRTASRRLATVVRELAD